MNELYFEGWGYFETGETDIDKVRDRFKEILAREGIDFEFNYYQLKNEDGEVIGWEGLNVYTETTK